ncbi:hypothetical protein [Ramlibacter sp. AN1133]|uniref:hypothetical protein n=1 Tax=Ramlibacter sp. AN1133 TaxID=3133429 RepID=UPI0030BB142A
MSAAAPEQPQAPSAQAEGDAAGALRWSGLIATQRAYALGQAGCLDAGLATLAWNDVPAALRARLLCGPMAAQQQAIAQSKHREQELLARFPRGGQVQIEKNAVIGGKGYAGRTGVITRANSHGGWYVLLDPTPRERTRKEVLILDSPGNVLVRARDIVSDGEVAPECAKPDRAAARPRGG